MANRYDDLWLLAHAVNGCAHALQTALATADPALLEQQSGLATAIAFLSEKGAAMAAAARDAYPLPPPDLTNGAIAPAEMEPPQ